MRRVRASMMVAVVVASIASAPGARADHSLTSLVSTGPAGGNGAFEPFFEGASADGTRVFFETIEKLVTADTDARFDVYERAGGVTTLVSTGPAGGNGLFDSFFEGASTDGSRVFFETDEQLVAADTDARDDVYERVGGVTTIVSTGPAGGNDDFDSFFRGASTDGSRVFITTAEKLVDADTDSGFALFDVYERAGGVTTLVSAGGNGLFDSFFDGASTDGSRVFFRTGEKLVAADTDASADVYERAGGVTTLVSTGPAGGNGAFDSFFAGVSTNGTRVFIETIEKLVAADTDARLDVYERAGGVTTRLSTGPAGGNDDFDSTFEGASTNGTRVFFETDETLVTADTDARDDVYERAGGVTTIVSTGPVGGNGADSSNFEGASTDGTRVFFGTDEKLVAADSDTSDDVYERAGGVTTLVSTGPAGGNGDEDADFEDASTDGSRVFFETEEELVAADSDASYDVYMSEIDVVPPETTIDSGPSDATASTISTFTFSSSEEGSSFECKLDAGAFAACSSPFTTPALADGEHSFEVKATDTAGNTDASPAARTWTVDTAPPETTIDSGPSAVSASTTSTFTFSSSETGSSFECSLDASPFAACSSPLTTLALADGEHTFEVKATDGAGNQDPTPAARTWTIDTTATEVSSSVGLNFKRGAFSGRVTTSSPGDPDAAAACLGDRKVRVKKLRRGPDATVATVRTNEQGRWRAGGFKGAEGRYRALVTEEARGTEVASVICGSDKSKVVRL